MKTNKKILAILIAVVLVITLLPSMAFADDPVSYNLWVGGVQVTSANAENITGDGIKGSVSYDPDTNTLTLKDATITGISDTDYADWKANIYAAGDLNVFLIGTNIVGNKSANFAIYSPGGDISVTGSGSLKAEGAACGIFAYNSVTIIDCEQLTATGSSNSGIWGYNGVTIKNSSISVASSPSGLETVGGAISIDGSTVTISECPNYGISSVKGEISIKKSNITIECQGYGIDSQNKIMIESSTVDSSANYQAISSGSTISISDDTVITYPEGAAVKGGVIRLNNGTGALANHVVIKLLPLTVKADESISSDHDHVTGYEIDAKGVDPGETVKAVPGDTINVKISLVSDYAMVGGKPAKLYYKTDGGTEKPIDFSVEGVTVTGSFEMPKDDVTVYAEWGKPQYKVSFETNGGSSVPDQTVEKGKTATKPEDPEKDGYKLFDWYEDEACTKRFDFTKAIEGNTTVYAYWVKVVNGLKLHADGTEKDSGGNYKLKTDTLELLFAKDTANVEIEVSPLSTDRDNSNLLTAEPEKDKEYWFRVEINDVDGVEEETLGRPTIWTGDEMIAGIDATAEDAVITFDEVAHSPAGKYTTIIFKYKENKPEPEPEPEPEPKPDPKPDPEPEPEPAPVVKPVYWVSEGTDLTVSKDTAEGLKLTVHRKPDDQLTYSLFTGVEMGGKQLSSLDFTAESGSLKLTVNPSYIKDLAEGSYKLTVKFSDGEATANVKVTEANDNPRTGDESGLMLWILIAIIAAGGIIAALLVYRKQSKRE